MNCFLISHKEDWIRRRDERSRLTTSPRLHSRAYPIPSLFLFSTFRQSLASTYLVCTTLSWAMDVDKNSTSYRVQERGSVRGLEGEEGTTGEAGREASQCVEEWGERAYAWTGGI